MKHFIGIVTALIFSSGSMANKNTDTFYLYDTDGSKLTSTELYDGVVIEIPVHPAEVQRLFSEIQSGSQSTTGKEFQKIPGAIGSVGSERFEISFSRDSSRRVSVSKHLNPIYGNEVHLGRAIWVDPMIAVVNPTSLAANISIRRSLISTKTYKVFFRPVQQLSLGGSESPAETPAEATKEPSEKHAASSSVAIQVEFERKNEHGVAIHQVAVDGRRLNPMLTIGAEAMNPEQLRNQGIGLHYKVISRGGVPTSPQNKPALGSQGQVFVGEVGLGADIEGVVYLVDSNPASPNHGAVLGQAPFRVTVLP